MSKTTLKIEFANKKALKHFATWLCEAGEQDYWEWMEIQEEEEDGPITAVQFQYHGPEDDTKDMDDPARWKKCKGFVHDNTIRTVVGRLDKGE